MKFISKKTWPYYFQLMIDGKKNTDLRLADFDVEPGDVIIFQEWNPDTESYTGREDPIRCLWLPQLWALLADPPLSSRKILCVCDL